MIPILFEKTETAFDSNGLGRLRDCISCVVTEERNGIYECDFEYPIDGVNYDRIQLGRIIGVEHDESTDIQPFDIVGYSRPINGIVTFHCTHISYRQCAMTVSGTNKQSLADAFTWLGTATPTNPFTYWTDKTSTGFLASADGIPHSVRQVLGGMEGSILDAYGGEYEWDTWTVKLWASRGEVKPFSIRYGVNLTDYSEEVDYSDTYTSVIPYWSGQDTNGNDVIVKGSKQTASYPSFNGMDRCIPLDVTDKFENKPTVAQVESAGLSYINTNQTYMPSQNITVDFLRLSESAEYAQFKSLQSCKLCDSINVYFPMYNMEGQFKIVKTEYDVLQERYSKLELGTLSTSLAEALGISQDSSSKLIDSVAKDFVVEEGTSTDGRSRWRKWNSGRAEFWYHYNVVGVTTAVWITPIYYMDTSAFGSIWNGVFNGSPFSVHCDSNGSQFISIIAYSWNSSGITSLRYLSVGAKSNNTVPTSIYAVGTWK